MQDLALQVLELPLGRFQQAGRAVGLAGPAAPVVAQALVGGRALHGPAVGEPGQVVRGHAQPAGQGGQVVDGGDGQRRAPISVGPPSTPAPGAAGRWGPAGRTARRRPRTWPAPGAVGRPVGVGAHHDLGHVDDPAALVGQGLLAAPAHGRRVPVPGQEGGGQGGGRARSWSARRTRSASAAGCAAAPPDRSCRARQGASECAPAQALRCRTTVVTPGGAPERPIGARRRRRPAREGRRTAGR